MLLYRILFDTLSFFFTVQQGTKKFPEYGAHISERISFL